MASRYSGFLRNAIKILLGRETGEGAKLVDRVEATHGAVRLATLNDRLHGVGWKAIRVCYFFRGGGRSWARE